MGIVSSRPFAWVCFILIQLMGLSTVPGLRTVAAQENSPLQSGIEDFQKGLYLKAIQNLQTGIQGQASPPPEAYFYLGSSLSRMGQYEEAIAILKKSLALLPENPEAHMDLGMALFNTRRYPEALAEFDKAIEYDPENGAARFFKGMTLKALDRNDQAISSFEEAGGIDPDFLQLARFNVALLRYKENRWDEAKTLFEQCIEPDPASEIAETAREFLKLIETQKPPKAWRAAFRAGGSIDDNVTLQNINLTTGLGDSISFYQFSGAYSFEPVETYTLGAGYDFFQSIYDSLHQFDMQAHTGYVSAAKNFGGFEFNLGYTFNYIALGNEDFENIHTLSSGINFELLDGWFVDLTYLLSFKDFYDIPARDAKNHSLRISNYFILNDEGALAWATYMPEGEITRDDQVTYVAQNVSTGIEYPLPLETLKTRLRTSYLYYYRDYLFNTPFINTERIDYRNQVSFEIIQPLLDHFDIIFQYQYVNSQSHLLANDFVENVFTLSMGATF